VFTELGQLFIGGREPVGVCECPAADERGCQSRGHELCYVACALYYLIDSYLYIFQFFFKYLVLLRIVITTYLIILN